MISAPRTVSELLALINPNSPLSTSSLFGVPSSDAWKLRVELQAALDSAEGQHYFPKVSCADSIASSNVWQPDRYVFNHQTIDHVHVKSEKRSSGTAIKTESNSGEKQKSETKKRWYSVTTSATTVIPTAATHGHHSEEGEEDYQECGSCDSSDDEASGAESDYYDEDGDSVSPPAKKRPKKNMDVRRK